MGVCLECAVQYDHTNRNRLLVPCPSCGRSLADKSLLASESDLLNALLDMVGSDGITFGYDIEEDIGSIRVSLQAFQEFIRDIQRAEGVARDG